MHPIIAFFRNMTATKEEKKGTVVKDSKQNGDSKPEVTPTEAKPEVKVDTEAIKRDFDDDDESPAGSH